MELALQNTTTPFIMNKAGLWRLNNIETSLPRVSVWVLGLRDLGIGFKDHINIVQWPFKTLF